MTRNAFFRLAPIVVLAFAAAAQGSWETKGHSVHFSEFEPDFGEPTAPISVRWNEVYDGRSGYNITEYRDLDGDRGNSLDGLRAARIANLRRREAAAARLARLAESKGKWAEALRHWRKARKENGPDAAIAQDRIEVFEQWTPKVPIALLKRYLGTRDRERSNDFARIRMLYQSIENDPRAGFLKAHAAYGVASASEPGGEELYAEVARRYPKSPRRESALLQAARCVLAERSSSPQENFGLGNPSYTPERIRKAKTWLTTLLADYPNSRLKAAALGWLGRAEYLARRNSQAVSLYRRQAAIVAGDERFRAWQSAAHCEPDAGKAFVLYLHMLRDADDPDQRYWSYVFLDRVRDGLHAAETKEVSRALEADPNLLDPYLEFRLGMTETSKAERAQLAGLAKRVFDRFPNASVRPRLMARLAEIEYRQGRYGPALTWATRGIAGGDGSDGLAHYMAASCRFRMGDLRGAENGYLDVIRRYPKSHLAKAAREPLALVRERRGDLAGALDLYFEMDYRSDIAYLLDARMTPEQVAAYAKRPEGRNRRNRINLAYGYRLLRVGKFEQAERAFASIPEKLRLRLAKNASPYGYSPFGDSYQEDLDKFFDPLATARSLGHLTRAAAKAKEGEPKARAMYALASFYRSRRHLLLYNADLWGGTRLYDFGWSWFEGAATPDDDRAAIRHHREHECLMHTYAICREIARKYPKSSMAAPALYRAATSAYTLCEFNDWWRKQGRAILKPQVAVDLMKRLAADYPDHALATNARKYARLWTAENRRDGLHAALSGD